MNIGTLSTQTNKINTLFLLCLGAAFPTFCQQDPPNVWDGEILRNATPKVKTIQDYWLSGKVRLVVEKQDSLYFDEQGSITRERKTGDRKAEIRTYEYDDQSHLTREYREVFLIEYDGIASYEPDKTYMTHWEYDRHGYLWRRIYLSTGVEKEQFEHRTFTTLKDTVVVRCTVDDQIQDVHTGWEYQYDQAKGIRNKYEWDHNREPKKILVETTNFDSAGNILKIVAFKDGKELLVFKRQESTGGHICSSYDYDENAKVRFEEKTIWKGPFKQFVRYYLPDSNEVMQLTHTKLFNEKGEAIADSLYDSGIVQQYYFKSGNPDFLQINTDKNGKMVWRIERKYNKKGYLIYQKSEINGSVTEEKYDNNFNRLYFKDSSASSNAQYEYDAQGNWVKASHSGTLFKPYKQSRSVFYHP